MGKLKCILIACLVLCLIGLVSISIFSKEAKDVTLENKQDKELASDTGINVDDQIERYGWFSYNGSLQRSRWHKVIR